MPRDKERAATSEPQQSSEGEGAEDDNAASTNNNNINSSHATEFKDQKMEKARRTKAPGRRKSKGNRGSRSKEGGAARPTPTTTHVTDVGGGVDTDGVTRPPLRQHDSTTVVDRGASLTTVDYHCYSNHQGSHIPNKPSSTDSAAKQGNPNENEGSRKLSRKSMSSARSSSETSEMEEAASNLSLCARTTRGRRSGSSSTGLKRRKQTLSSEALLVDIAQDSGFTGGNHGVLSGTTSSVIFPNATSSSIDSTLEMSRHNSALDNVLNSSAVETIGLAQLAKTAHPKEPFLGSKAASIIKLLGREVKCKEPLVHASRTLVPGGGGGLHVRDNITRQGNPYELPEKQQAANDPTQPAEGELPSEESSPKEKRKTPASEDPTRQGGRWLNEASLDKRGGDNGAKLLLRDRISYPSEYPTEKQVIGMMEVVPSALDMHVIDGGATNLLVLTASDATRSQPMASDCTSKIAFLSKIQAQSIASKGHQKSPHRRRILSDSDEQEHNRVHREKVVAAGSLVEGEPVDRSSDTGPEKATVEEECGIERKHVSHATLPLSPYHANGKQRRILEHYNEPLMRLDIGKTSRNTSTSLSVEGLTPSFSSKEEIAPHCSPPELTTIPCGSTQKLPDGSTVDCPFNCSPASSSSTTSLGDSIPGRTVKYVQQQVSFHAGISDDFIDQNSPTGRAASHGSPRKAVSAAETSRTATKNPPITDKPRLHGDWIRPRKTRHGLHPKSSRPPAILGAGRQEATPDCSKIQLIPTVPNAPPNPKVPEQAALPAPFGIVYAQDSAKGDIHIDPDSDSHRLCAPPKNRGRHDSGLEQSEQPRSPSSASSSGDNRKDNRFAHFRTELSHRLVSGERPVLLFLRPNESLAVTRIEGVGRLLVTLREEAGAALVVVDAVVHDSAAYFGQAAIQTDHRFPYVAGHHYEFQVAPTQGVELAVHGENGQATASFEAAVTTPTACIQAVFSVTSAFTEDERVYDADVACLSLPAFEAPIRSSLKGTQLSPTEETPKTNLPGTVNSETQRPPQSCNLNDKQPSSCAAAALTASFPSPPLYKSHDATGLGRAVMTQKSAELAPAEARQPLVCGRVGKTTESGLSPSSPLDARPGGSFQSDSSVKRGYKGNEKRTGESSRALLHRSPVLHGTKKNITLIKGEAEPTHRPSAVYPCLEPSAVGLAARSRTHVEAGLPRRESAESMTVDYHLEEGLRWNPVWERQFPSAPQATQIQTSLPYLRRHIENSPRSAFGHLDSEGKRNTREASARYRFCRAPSRVPDLNQRRRQFINEIGGIVDSRSIPETHYLYNDHPIPIHEQNGHPLCEREFEEGGRAIFSPPHVGRGGSGRGRSGSCAVDWDQRALKLPTDSRDLMVPEKDSGPVHAKWERHRGVNDENGNMAAGRPWGGDDSWVRNCGGEPTWKPLHGAVARNDYSAGNGYYSTTEHNEGSGFYRFRHGKPKPPFDKSRRRVFPASDKSYWETETPSNQRLAARGYGKRRGQGNPATEEACMTENGGYSETAATNGEGQGGHEVRYGSTLGRKRAQQQTHHITHEPPASRKIRRNTERRTAQIGVAGGRTVQMPPRWVKF